MSKNACVLVVDDDDGFRKSIVNILKMENYDVLEAANGKEALNMLGVRKNINVILSDVRMPIMHGVELMHSIKREKIDCPLIMMTGFSDIIEMKEAYEIGVSGFLSKPFDSDELLSSISVCLDNDTNSDVTKDEIKAENDKYISIEIDKFEHGSHYETPIFVKLGEGRYVKIAHKGEDINISRIDQFKNKGIDNLYLLATDMSSSIERRHQASDTILASSKVSAQNKISYLQSTGDILFQYSFNSHIDKEMFSFAKTNVENAIELMIDKDSIFESLQDLQKYHKGCYSHSLEVSLISVLIAKEKQLQSDKIKDILVQACVLHDIGTMKVLKRVREIPALLMNDEEYKMYQSHVVESVNELKKAGVEREEVLNIVMQHHENCAGTGYPNKLLRHKIHPLSKIVRLADEFSYVANIKCSNNMARSLSEIFLELDKKKNEFEKDDLEALKRVFGHSH